MKKVTRRLLVATVAAMGVVGFSACSDDVTVVQPPPPEPPPPEDAELTIQAIRDADDNTVVDPDDVNGRIIVVLNVVAGDQGVTQIDLLVDQQVVPCQTVAAGSVEGVQLSTSSNSQDTVECFLNTARGVGECTGAQLDPDFDNGPVTLGAQVSLDDGSVITAENAQELTFTNTNTLNIVRTTGTGVVGNGVRYFGGEQLDFAACPVDFDGRTIGEVQLAGSSAGSTGSVSDVDMDGNVGSVDFGSGEGVIHSDAESPFVFSATVANNDGEVEDDPTLAGHTIGTGGVIFTDEGENVTASYDIQTLALFLDFTGPNIDPGAFITIDAMANTNGHYSAGDFGLSASVTDAGVGLGAGGGATVFNVNDDVGGAPLVEGATGIGDLTEDDNLDDGDANGVDTYEVEVISVADLLGNLASAADLANIVPNPDGPFGVDVTAPDITNLQPDTDPADDPVLVLNDVSLMFDAADPLLASGDPGSGVDLTGCDNALGGTACTNITATDENGDTYEVDEIPAAGGSFTVDIANAGGLASAAAALADGSHTVTVDVPDLAVLTPNTGTDDFTFILDTTSPQFGGLNPVPGGSAGTDATSIIQSIGGTITDANVIASAVISVFVDGTDATGTDSDTVCDAATDWLLDVGAGEIDRNEIDVASATNDIAFNESFEIFEPTSASVTVTYCFIIEAADEAADKTGADNPNIGELNTQADVTWQG